MKLLIEGALLFLDRLKNTLHFFSHLVQVGPVGSAPDIPQAAAHGMAFRLFRFVLAHHVPFGQNGEAQVIKELSYVFDGGDGLVDAGMDAAKPNRNRIPG
jgi:hypothetical protein